MSAPLLRIEHLEVRYGDLIGVSDVSLDVPEGSVVALLGSNGGGKTTVLNAHRRPDPVHSGSIGASTARRSAARARLRSCARASRCRRKAGGCSCSRASRTICCSAPRRCATRRAPRHCSERVYEIFPKLTERRSQRAGTMSGGERQMLAVGRALMSDPKLLMLDEPSLGLAPTVVEIDVRDVWPAAPGRADHPAGGAIDRAGAGGLGFRDGAAGRQRACCPAPRRRCAEDPQVQKAYLGA